MVPSIPPRSPPTKRGQAPFRRRKTGTVPVSRLRLGTQVAGGNGGLAARRPAAAANRMFQAIFLDNPIDPRRRPIGGAARCTPLDSLEFLLRCTQIQQRPPIARLLDRPLRQERTPFIERVL